MSSTEDVRKYYDEKTETYLKIYGDIIQAFRPISDKSLLKYLKNSIGLQKNQNILDAGCGVGGPSLYFASQCDINIEGITLSPVQASIAQQKIQQKRLSKRVHIIEGDYHKLEAIYGGKSFDGVLFLESLGHSDNASEVLEQACKLTKVGGFIYIKDFFKKESANTELQEKVDVIIDRMNKHYQYNTLKLLPILKTLRENDFEIDFIKKFDFKDDTSIRAKFENHEKIDIFEGYKEFWPAEWLEIRCIKC